MAQGDAKAFAEYDKKLGEKEYDNSTDTFSWVLITDDYASIDANMVNPTLASFTQATVGGNYAGKTALTGSSWTRSGAVSTIDFDDITFAADASNPTDAKCLLIINDTDADDDAFRVTDLTTDGTTAVDLTQGFTFTFNAAGTHTLTTNA